MMLNNKINSNKNIKNIIRVKSNNDLNDLKLAYSNGDYTEVLIISEKILNKDNSNLEVLTILWASFRKLGNFNQALNTALKVVEYSPGDASAHSNLGIAQKDLGLFEESEKTYIHAIKLDPNHIASYGNLGNLLVLQKKFQEAIVVYKKYIKLNPKSAFGYINLGCCLREVGDLNSAESHFRQAINIDPKNFDALSNLGVVLKELNRISESEIALNQAIKINPNHASAYNNLGVVRKILGRFSDSEICFRKAISLQPNFANALSNLGNILRDSRRLSEAEACYRQALLLQTDCSDAHGNLGVVLAELGRLSEAEKIFRNAVGLRPNSVEDRYNLANVLKDLGRLDEALENYCYALKLKPDYTNAHTNLLFLLAYHGLKSNEEYLSLARAWETTVLSLEDQIAAKNRSFKRYPLNGRRLRVGYVSGDFRQHAVTYFIEQIFKLHDRNRIELFAYSSRSFEDTTTVRLKKLVENWRCITESADISRKQIEKDSIDILIDLSGHTGHNRLDVFAGRAAPVQAHYLGYHASTGLTEMDYWIGDEVLTPPATDIFFCETIWRLPRIWIAYNARPDAPCPNWSPRPDGRVYLGSLNNLSKLTESTLTLWAKILHRLPQGHLLLKTKELVDASNRERVLYHFAQLGIASERITLNDASLTPDWPSHMAFYDNLDIALDPVGAVSGGTTTCDALWMGVPVITLMGQIMGQRMSASMLHAIGQDDWIANSESEYIDKVVVLANDIPRRKALRITQRERMRLSPLCDASGLVKEMEESYFAMFERWQQT